MNVSPVEEVFLGYHAIWWRKILMLAWVDLPAFQLLQRSVSRSASDSKQYALLRCRLSSKMPIQTEKGKLHVDLKALGQVLWRSTIVHIFR